MSRISGKQDRDNRLEQIGDAIRTARMLAGLSQEALADAAGLDRSHLGRIERGERNVTLLNLLKVADAIGLPLSEVLKHAAL